MALVRASAAAIASSRSSPSQVRSPSPAIARARSRWAAILPMASSQSAMGMRSGSGVAASTGTPIGAAAPDLSGVPAGPCHAAAVPFRTRMAALAATACAVAVVVATGCAGAGAAPSAAPVPAADRFDAARAWADLRMQVALGPRPAGSAASRTLADRLRRALPAGRFEPVPGGLRKVVGSLPGRGR